MDIPVICVSVAGLPHPPYVYLSIFDELTLTLFIYRLEDFLVYQYIKNNDALGKTTPDLSFYRTKIYKAALLGKLSAVPLFQSKIVTVLVASVCSMEV